jgi:hypothetical protein
MWIFTKDGFFSVVQHLGDDTKLIVRARDKHDLLHARARMPNTYIGVMMHTPNADYEWRFVCDRGVWQQYCEEAISNIDYANFKNSIFRKDEYRANLYAEVGAVMARLQNG